MITDQSVKGCTLKKKRQANDDRDRCKDQCERCGWYDMEIYRRSALIDGGRGLTKDPETGLSRLVIGKAAAE